MAITDHTRRDHENYARLEHALRVFLLDEEPDPLYAAELERRRDEERYNTFVCEAITWATDTGVLPTDFVDAYVASGIAHGDDVRYAERFKREAAENLEDCRALAADGGQSN